MRTCKWTWTAIAVPLLAISMVAEGQCVSALQSVSVPGVVPNHFAAALAWSGDRLAVSKNGTDGASSLWISLYDENLAPKSDDLLVASSTLSGAIALVWN